MIYEHERYIFIQILFGHIPFKSVNCIIKYNVHFFSLDSGIKGRSGYRRVVIVQHYPPIIFISLSFPRLSNCPATFLFYSHNTPANTLASTTPPFPPRFFFAPRRLPTRNRESLYTKISYRNFIKYISRSYFSIWSSGIYFCADSYSGIYLVIYFTALLFH